jgi:hypothetical protein
VWGVMNRYQGDEGFGGLYNPVRSSRGPKLRGKSPSLSDDAVVKHRRPGQPGWTDGPAEGVTDADIADALREDAKTLAEAGLPLRMAHEPDPDDEVLVVREAGSMDGEAIVVVWWFDSDFAYDQDAAYASAIRDCGDNLISGEPMFESMAWKRAQATFVDAHVYDRYMYVVEPIEE